MIDALASQLSLRNRALSAIAATTGATTLTATATGYSRVAGSFLTDGFTVGMEVTPSGFASNPVDIIIGVSAIALTTLNARTAESSSAGRSLTVPAIPLLRAWENVDFVPTTGRPFVEEDFVPATSRLLSFPAQSGTAEETGLYILKLYVVQNYGIGAARRMAQALLAVFAPGTAFDPTGTGTTALRVRSDIGPYAGQLLPQGDGWAVVTVTVPWRAFSPNVVAA